MGKVTEMSRRRFVASALSAAALAAFGGELTATKVKDSPARDLMPAVQQEKILNARLRSGNLEISASDWLRPDRTPIRGNTVCLYLSGGTIEELKALFERLSEGAEVTDPLKEQFFGTLRSTQRQVWCPVDVSNRQEGLGKRVLGQTKRHRSERYEIHFADVRHEGRR